MAGYSGTPLCKKLGIRADQNVCLDGAPTGFAELLVDLPAGVELHDAPRGKQRFDLTLCFVRSRAELRVRFPKLAARTAEAGGVWIAWPKRASKIETDMSEDVARELVLPSGWVDNKICAIDETWSAVRFVKRLELRAKPARRN